jgi:hypothetical protein
VFSLCSQRVLMRVLTCVLTYPALRVPCVRARGETYTPRSNIATARTPLLHNRVYTLKTRPALCEKTVENTIENARENTVRTQLRTR